MVPNRCREGYTLDTDQAAFLAFHDEYLNVMERAYATGGTEAVLPMLGPDYHGYFGTRREDRASFYDLADAVEGIQQTAKAYPGVRSGCHGRYVRMPSETEAVVFYEKSMDFGTRVGYALVMEVWRRLDGNWRLVRDTVESA